MISLRMLDYYGVCGTLVKICILLVVLTSTHGLTPRHTSGNMLGAFTMYLY